MNSLRQTPNAKAFEAAIKNYGSQANAEEYTALLAADISARKQYKELCARLYTEAEIIEEMTMAPPYFMDPLQLRVLPLFLLGVPDGSDAHTRINDRIDLRINRRPEVKGEHPPKPIWRDFTDLGWPKSMGNPKLTSFDT